MADEFENIKNSAIINRSVIKDSFNKAVFTGDGNIIQITDSQFREVLKEVITAPTTSIRYNASSDAINAQYSHMLQLYTDQLLETVKQIDQTRGMSIQGIQSGDLQISRRDLEFRQAYNKGNAYMRKNDFVNSLTYYSAALEINPNMSSVWNNQGNALASLGRYDDAINSYDKGLNLDPNDEALMYNKGISLLSYKDMLKQ